MKQDDGDLEYDMGDEPFYDDEVKDCTRMNPSNVKMGQLVKKEVTDFEKIMAECEGLLNRKSMLLKL